MTPLDLQDELAKVIEELFSGYDYRLPGGVLTAARHRISVLFLIRMTITKLSGKK